MLSHDKALESDWVNQYVLGELSQPERERFEAHLFDCSICSERVRIAYLLVRGAEASLKHEITRQNHAVTKTTDEKRIRASAPIKFWRLTWITPAIAAATLILVVTSSYQNFFQIPVLRHQVEMASDVESSPVYYLSETKSETGLIAVPASLRHVSLLLNNIPGQTYPSYNCELRDQSGRVVRSFQVNVMADLEQWELRLPIQGLSSQPYLLEVRGPSDASGVAGPVISEYHFRLKIY